MNQPCALVQVDQGKEACLYSIHFAGEVVSEFELALANLAGHMRLPELLARVADHLQRFGFTTYNLKDESPDPNRQVWAIWRGDIRIFGILWNHQLFICGNGGRKTTHTLQQNRHHLELVQHLQRLEQELQRRVAAGEVIVGPDGLLSGNLRFEV